jgi:hypothetical protein
MSVQHANIGVVKKDLQLYYNREFLGSFEGEATVNVFSIPTPIFQKEGNHSTSFVTSTTTGIPDLVVSGNKQVYYISEYYTIVATGAWSNEVNRVLIYAKGGMPTSTSFRLSFYARSLSGNTQLGYSFYGSGINFTANLTTKWQRFSCTATTQATYAAVEFGNIAAGSMVCQIACIQVEAKSYTTPFTLPVLWTPNLVNVTSTSGHTTITRGATNNNDWTQSRIYSSEGYSVPCYVSFKASQTGCPIMLGLNSDPSTGINYTYLDYAWYVTWDTGNPSYIYENGTPYGPYDAYTTSTIFEIIYDGTNINYYLNGVLKRSVARSSTSPLYLDSSFYSTNNGGAINSLSFGPLSQINRFSNYVIGGGGLLDISGNNYNIDLSGANVLFDSGGFYFNGNTAGPYITPISNSTLDSLSNNTHTYEVWFKLLGTPAGLYDGYFFGRSGYHEGFTHLKSSSNTIYVITWYFDDTNTALGATLSLNTWYHGVYVANVEAATRQLYINGSLVDNNTLTKQLRQYTSAYYIGAASVDYASNSIVSTARAYNRALTAAEVLQNFNATRKTYGI